MEITPQYVLDKLLELARGLDRSANVAERQNDRIDHLDERVEALERINEHNEQEVIDDAKSRASNRVAIYVEMLKGVVGAVIGAIATIAAQHLPALQQHK